MLEERTYMADEWDGTIIPLIKEGVVLRDRKDLCGNRFLVISQAFAGYVQDGEKIFYCTGWMKPKPHVIVAESFRFHGNV